MEADNNTHQNTSPRHLLKPEVLRHGGGVHRLNRLVVRVLRSAVLIVGVDLQGGIGLAEDAHLDVPALSTIGSGSDICPTMRNNWVRRP